MIAAARAFNEKLGRKATRRQVTANSSKGELKYRISMARQNMNSVLEAFRCILYQMCCITYKDWHERNLSWETRWKGVSEMGYDIIRNRVIDYGNREYNAILQFLYLQDKYCREAIEFLVEYWPSLHPLQEEHYSNVGVSKKGDVIEICLAALRGHRDFDMSRALERNQCNLPTLFCKMCKLSQLVQYVDAAAGRGSIKASEKVLTLVATELEFQGDEFIIAWKARRGFQQGYCLHALLSA